MQGFLPVWVTILLILVFVVIAIVPPRLHYGIRFAIMLVLFGIMFGLGVVSPDLYLAAFPPLDEHVGDFNLWMVGVLGFVLGFLVSILAWVIRKVMGRGAAAAE